MSEQGSGDERINAKSPDFDPLQAIYSDDVVAPWPEAVAFDNVASFEAIASKSDGSTSLDEVKVKPEPKPKVEILKRELPVASTSRIVQKETSEEREIKLSKKFENVLTLLDKAEGPLQMLKDAMYQRVRVKVFTRNRATLRGHFSGFILAFDKHWNIAMEDVTEIWVRKIKRKTIIYGTPEEIPHSWLKNGPPYEPPTTRVIEKQGRKETCRRYMKQILLRGEHVVSVIVDNTGEAAYQLKC